MSRATSGFKDDSNGTLAGDPVDDYQYDLNGNMITDQNKNITSIAYNHLNLPTKITFSTGSNIVYVYDATGVKLKKVVTVSPTVTTTEYLSGFQYTNNVLQFFPTAEGYVKHTLVSSTSKFNYVYNYTDHLGNVRMSYTKNPATGTLKIIEENHNYPFGLKHNYNNADYEFTVSGSNVVLTQVSENKYNYQYNGKEWQDELGYNMYDMDMRQYDPAIARWVVQDPIVHHSMSTYNAFDNNPVFWADPSGASPIYNEETGQYVINGKVVDFQKALDYANSGGNSDGSNNNEPDDKEDPNKKSNAEIKKIDQQRAIEIGEKEKKEQDNNYNFFYESKDKGYRAMSELSPDGVDGMLIFTPMIVINSHGGPNKIVAPYGNDYRFDAEELHNYLKEFNEDYKASIANNSKIKIKINACNTGNGLAKKLSKLNPNAIIIAPTTTIVMRFGINIPTGDGKWVKYQNGKKIN